MATIFSRIIAGEIPAHRIAETDEFFAFLDINPIQMGHTLVVPKREEDYLFDLTDHELSEIILFARKVADAIKRATSCTKVGMSVIGLEVNHAHIHLVPLNGLGDMDFSHKLSPSSQELEAMAERIRQEFK